MAIFHILLLTWSGIAGAVNSHYGLSLGKANPIRRVVHILHKMQGKVEKDTKKDEELFEKFMHYCSKGPQEVQKTIAEGEKQVPQLESSVKETQALKDQLSMDVKQHKKDQEEARATIDKATSIREGERAAYAKESNDLKKDIKAVKKAYSHVKKGQAGFLQSSVGKTMRQMILNMYMSSTDRDILSSYFEQEQEQRQDPQQDLQQDQAEEYAPQAGDVLAILQRMHETMQKELAEASAAEQESETNYNALVAAKKKEIEADAADITAKLRRHGSVSVQLETLSQDLEDSSNSLAQNKKFLADLQQGCANREKEWEALKEVRARELQAILETIKLLSDHDALDLFKKALPSPLLLQMKVTSKQMRSQALLKLQPAKRRGSLKDDRVNLISLALHGQKVSFDKIIGLIKDMREMLAREEVEDERKVGYCTQEIDTKEDTIKDMELSRSDLEKEIADEKSNVDAISEEITAMENGIKSLDKQVAEATQIRKEESEEYTKSFSNKRAAKELLLFAQNRLNKFYNPKLYLAPPKRELSEVDQLTLSMGGTLAPTAPPAALEQEGSSPGPDPVRVYVKLGSETGGVLAMMNTLIKDLDKEMSAMEVEEKDAQREYEQFIQDSAIKRAADAKSIAQKQSTRADLNMDFEKMTELDKSKARELHGMIKILGDLHKECDWLVANFKPRKEAREVEVESLKQAETVLSGTDLSLLQASHTRQRHPDG